MNDLFGASRVFIPVISLWQPWASLCFVDDAELRKLDETRHWQFPERLRDAEIAIQAAQKFPAELNGNLDEVCRLAFGDDYRKALPRGCIVGTVTLAACRPVAEVRLNTTAANLAAGNFDDFSIVNGRKRARYAWRLVNPSRLPTPLPEKGKQGWSSIDRARLAP